jgi:hypothetical protein
MIHHRQFQTDRAGRAIRIGDFVRLPRSVHFKAHRDYRQTYRRLSRRVLPVIGWDTTGLAWVPIGKWEVLSVEPWLLQIVRRTRIKRKPLMDTRMASNRTPHSDAREASHLVSPSQSRAGGRGRWATGAAEILKCIYLPR